MNCFHFSVSLGYKTTTDYIKPFLIRLWIAFIFQYLWDTKQPAFGNTRTVIVVNCFHFSVSLGYKTTKKLLAVYQKKLWIAFIFQYLWDTKQLSSGTFANIWSCELLSFFSIFGIQNNIHKQKEMFTIVVNCFHFSVSLGYKTTNSRNNSPVRWLWIAFIFQYLWDTKQLYRSRWSYTTCCELLSFFSIFGIQNNNLKHLLHLQIVVNCFHFSVSLGYKTTNQQKKRLPRMLWIAFIFQYLWDTKQQFTTTSL